MSTMRLDKFLATMGCGTRSEVKKLLKAAEITVNGTPEKRPEQKVDPEKDEVCCQGRRLCYTPFVCLMFFKPAGCITAVSDRTQKTVMDFITHDRKGELFPVGRLDIDTEGLLLLMNDGELAHRMLSPRHHVKKTYFARVRGVVTEEDAAAFEAGVDIGEKRLTMPAKLNILKTTQDSSEVELMISEGKFHQVKRMFAARGKQVEYLKRISMGGIALDEGLKPGQWRELTEEEIALLHRRTQKNMSA